MFTEDSQLDIMRESRKALNKIKEHEDSQVDTLTEAYRVSNEMDMGKGLYQPFDQIVFEGKIRVDMMYYDQLFQKLDESVHSKIEEVMTALFTNVRKIYEFVNIKPEIYGKRLEINEDILDDSLERSQRKLSKAIYENLDLNFYRLNEEQRKERYYEACKETIKDLITDGSDPTEATKFGIKVAVLENLLRSISFPGATWSRVTHLTESVNYGKIFDQNRLVGLVEAFEKKIHNIAKIIATVV
jgi:hypothetical protein